MDIKKAMKVLLMLYLYWYPALEKEIEGDISMINNDLMKILGYLNFDVKKLEKMQNMVFDDIDVDNISAIEAFEAIVEDEIYLWGLTRFPRKRN